MTDPIDALRAFIAQVVRDELARQRPPAAVADEYLSVARAAAVADVAPGTVRRWIREGRLVGHHAGRVLRVKRTDLEALLRGGGRRDRELTAEQLADRDFG